MKVSGAWIESRATQAVCAMLTEGGYQAFFVGGCVRNALLGMPVGDVDIATDARPDVVMKLATAAGLKPVPTGIEHGTITVVSSHIGHEVTTFREDVQTFGRHAVVAFGTDIGTDARRRDFTMNALYARPDGSVVDPLGGLEDLRARRVRFIEDAEQRIREDYLRILRFFRFHAWYGDPEGGLDAEGLAAAAGNVDGLARLSRERVGAEMRKLLAAPDPAPSVAAMQAAGVLHGVLPGSDARGLTLLVHLESETNTAPDAILRLAALGGDAVAERLRLSRAEARRLDLLRAAAAETTQAAELGYRHGAEDGRAVLLLRAALLEMPWRARDAEDLAQGAEARFPVTAADLMPEYSGQELGARLQELEQAWIASGFTLTRDDLL
ncbi:MAG: CCA tRNA nucleotidyltransferase [Roseovarius sp.]|uniref:CCA tRNA nucleotidyltransferase n=1 Tax=Roseovarius sp. TaxID=1486281 RepID=UPI001B737B7C|nr:CCA tRNA nucleotidyltransferase [Roseovarius sp.]MBQ0750924.1 CCA tRNA nucleotidyltransferase [Roseovarius sp.]MBQ0810249.1 CCA tRNA nucleotidyltransferase [Roseovarius sp.]